MPGQKIADRVVSALVPNGRFVGRLEIVDVQHFARPSGLGKMRQQGLFLSQGHVLALAPAARLASQPLEPAVVIGHVGPVHRAQRHSHRFRDRRLRHSALTQQYHLDAVALLGMSFPTQRCFQTPNLHFGAFDHLLLRISQMVRANHTPTLECNSLRHSVPQYRRTSIQSAMETVLYARCMSDPLRELTAFVRAGETGSFSRVARELGVSQPSISRMVAGLEARLGVKLLLRTTRLVTLTDAGRVFLERARQILGELDDAENAARGLDSLRGTLRVALSGAFGIREVID